MIRVAGPWMAVAVATIVALSGCKKEDDDAVAPPADTTPSLSGVLPTGAMPGTRVTIIGNNLTGATGVLFNQVSAGSAFTVVNDTSMIVTVPATATKGVVKVETPTMTTNGVPFNVLTRQGETLSSKTWRLKAVTSSPVYRVGTTNYPDLFLVPGGPYPSCYKGRVHFFQPSGSYTIEPGTLPCVAGEPTLSGTWELNTGATQLQTRFVSAASGTPTSVTTAYTVVYLSPTLLNLRYSRALDASGTLFSVSETYEGR